MIGNQYIKQIDPNIAAEAFSNGLLAQLTANGGVEGGNIGKTTHIVLKTTSGTIQLGSGGNGNEVVFYQDGDDFANNIVKTRVFLSKGQIHIENGCQDGTVITSSQGICGASGNGDPSTSDVSPMPLGNEGFAGRQFFLFAFRSSANPTLQSRGEVYVAAGAVSSEVSLLNGNGQTVVDGSYTIPPYGLKTFLTDADSEFQVVASQNVFVGIAANMGQPNPRFYDMRLVPPLATNLIGQNRNGRLSALYNNTEVWWYRQNGQIGKLIVSPGSPIQIYNGTRNLLGDVFSISSSTTSATGGTFTITVNGETTGNIVYNANSSQILTALSGLASYSETDFIVEMTRGDNLGQSNAQAIVYCQGLLARVVGTPSINNSNIVGNSHTYFLQQAGNLADNAGSDADYSKEGIVHLEAKNGVISCLSGADGSGLEATYYMPTKAMTQVIPLYLCALDSGSGRSSSIAIQSLYIGNFKIYDQNNVLKYSGSFDRGITAGSGTRQLIPTGITIAPTGQDIAFTEDFLGGYIESDVPINIVFNSDENQDLITGGIPTESDEIVMYGVTPNDIRTVFKKSNDGFTYKLNLDYISDSNLDEFIKV